MSAVLDCREVAAFYVGHYVGAGNIPAAELPQRMHELPKTSESLCVYADVEDLPAVLDFLAAKGYQVTVSKEWTAELQASLQAEGLWATGAGARLWQPAPLLARFVHEFMPTYGITPGIGLDIGCGAGRDLVYLAMHGWQMTGVDYMPAALQRAEKLAENHQVVINTWLCDLETGQDPFSDFADGQFDLICVARYLHRPLFAWMKRILKPNGIVIYQTFLQGAEKFGSPKNPNFLLKAGELASIFSDSTRLLDTVEYLDDGRPVSAFICRNV